MRLATEPSGDAAGAGHAGQEPVVMALGTGRLRFVYEAVMVALALAVIWLLTLDDVGWIRYANLAIWAVFVIDYGVRLALSSDRRAFVRANLPDLIAILPLDFFRIARLARLTKLVRLLRAASVLWRVSKDLRGVVGTNGLGYVLLVNGALVLIGAVAILLAEPAITSLGDAVWWSLVTATTVGYGDLSPASPIGRVIASVLMVVGIGTIGMVTGSIATYFIHGREDTSTEDEDVEHIRQRLASWAEMTTRERHRLVRMLEGCVD